MNNLTFTEEELDLFVCEPEQFSEQQQKEIEQYLAQNTVADEYVQKQRLFYQEMDKRIHAEPSSLDKQFAEQISTSNQKFLPSLGLMKSEKEEVFSGYSELFEVRQSLPQRFIRYARVYPIQTTSYVATIAAALVLLFTVIKPTVDGNPSYAETKNNVLTVYNTQGQILFTKPAAGTPDYNLNTESNNQFIRPFLIADVNRDGTNEVLTNLYNQKNVLATNTLICYSNQGREMWKYTPTFDLSDIDNGSKTATRSVIFDFAVGGATKTDQPKLFVAVADPTFSPSCVVKVNLQTLSEEQRYWHTGGINKIFIHDVNADGKAELLIAGINDNIDMVFVAGINMESIDGKTSTSNEQFSTIRKVNELFYCMLPPIEFYEKLAATKFNTLWILKPLSYGESAIDIETSEIPNNVYDNTQGGIHYIFDNNLKISSVSASSNFEKIYNEYRESKDRSMDLLTQTYFEKLKQNVRWWDGEKFVNYPTFNKQYKKEQPLP